MSATRLATIATLRHPSFPLPSEHVPETTLRDAVEREGPAILAALSVEALRAVAALHALGLAHGEILPSTVRVRSTPRLGARLVLALPPDVPPDLASDARTLPFTPPEMLDGAPWTEAADLYALGAVLFHALHGRTHVRTDAEPSRVRAAIREGRRSRPPEPEGTPPGLSGRIERLLAIDVGLRPADAVEALHELGSAPETPAGRAARVASGRPPGLERECEEVLREVEREDGARVVLVVAPRGAGAHRVLDWVAWCGRAAPGGDAIRVVGPVGAIEALDGTSGRVVVEVRPGRFGDAPWPGARVVRVPAFASREAARALAARAGEDDPATEARFARRIERAGARWVEASWLACRCAPEVLLGSLTPTARRVLGTLDAVGATLREDEVAQLIEAPLDSVQEAAAELRILGWLDMRDSRWRAILPSAVRDALPVLAGRAVDALHRSVCDASDRALERGAPGEAAELLRGILTRVPRRDARRSDLRMRHGEALERAGHLRAAGRAYAGAALRADRVDARSAALAARGRVRARLATLDRPGSSDDPRAAACSRLTRAARSLASGHVESVLDDAIAVLGFARAADDPLLAALAASLHARALDHVASEKDALEAAAASTGLFPAWDELRRTIDDARAASRAGRTEDAARGARDAAFAADVIDAPGDAAEAWAIAAQAEATDPDLAESARREGRARLDVALDRISDPERKRGFADHPRFAALRGRPAGFEAVDRRLVAIYDMIRHLNSEAEPESLLPQILSMALAVVRAERGLVLLLADDGSVRVRAARQLDGPTLADAESFSRGVVAEAAAGRSVLAVDAATDARFTGLESVSVYGIRSLMCVPLRSRGRLIGTVYADHRGERGRFDADDLRFLEAFADHAALALENAETRAALDRENRELRSAAVERAHDSGLIGDSEPMRRVLERIRVVASSDLPVLITGESGTGKELAARAIHFRGPRCDGPFVTENCAALPETLLEAELFGHVRGAFTGAERDRPGLFEQADGGTLLLDEIGDMSPRMQAQLLRVLETGQVRRVGSDRTRTCDVRLVAATHRDLEAAARDGGFRADLLYRLQVLTVELPPLRDRPGDVRRLVERFLARAASERGRAAPRILPAALSRLESHAWPGNVRELQNVVYRAVVLAGDGPITLELLDTDPSLRAGAVATRGPDGPGSLAASERRVIADALRAAGGNRARAARLLGISRATLYRRLGEG